jgi:aminopeptidase YwaD
MLGRSGNQSLACRHQALVSPGVSERAWRMIDHPGLELIITQHLTQLAAHIGARPTGSSGNWQAGDYLRSQFMQAGWQVETPSFDCKTWQSESVSLYCQQLTFNVEINPYSPSFEGTLPFVICETLAALQAQGSLKGRVVVLTGELAQYPYMPRNFPFMTFEEQLRILDALERARPEAIIGICSSPLFCDADFPIPSVTLSPVDETWLTTYQGHDVTLSIKSTIIPSTGFNMIAHGAERSERKIVICAHYDTWFDTPGALDNAAGVSALLTLAQVLRKRSPQVELVALNGEDHYAAPGQVNYLAGGTADIDYVINIDGIGAVGKCNSLAYFGDNNALFSVVRAIKQDFPDLMEVEPWPQGDHMIFVQRGIPAIALSSADAFDLWMGITHTPKDTLDQVDPAKVAEVVAFVTTLCDRPT